MKDSAAPPAWRRALRPLRHAAVRAYERVGAQVLDRGRVQHCDVRGHAVDVVTESSLERFRARTYGSKEPETLDWIERYFTAGDVLYDVGANIGLYSLFAARRLAGRCRVYAFEPEALNHADLNRNIYLNQLSGVVVPCCMALSDAVGFDRFFVNVTPPADGASRPGELVAGSALHNFGAPVDFRNRPFAASHEQGTASSTIDHLWSSWHLEFPNHLKIDVDGIEHRVIAGASRTLGDPRLKSVLVEITDSSPFTAQIVAALQSAGLEETREFAAHSSTSLAGTDYEGCVNRVFVRPL